MINKMSNKCCSGPIQDEINISGGGFRNRIQKNQDYCAVLRIPANQTIYIVSEDKINEIANENNGSNSSSSNVNGKVCPSNSGLIITVASLSVLVVLLIILLIWILIRKSKSRPTFISK